MANPSFSIDDEVLDDLDDVIWEKKVAGELDKNTSRSEVVQGLIEDYIEGNGNSSTGTKATATSN
ncbi:hypothetical protein [Halobacterium sp. KA-6]|uniref:hypothetical protein n=1 Tax=Halobacterium sp. KA-6 TaxID=2896368 RepID=UPI001E3CB9F2|nr:hypothetical protein [Halobacterium sp. KA-6]MCD2204386.1 hypothetical protein [Halobacterium sp. KA-6]